MTDTDDVRAAAERVRAMIEEIRAAKPNLSKRHRFRFEDVELLSNFALSRLDVATDEQVAEMRRYADVGRLPIAGMMAATNAILNRLTAAEAERDALRSALSAARPFIGGPGSGGVLAGIEAVLS